MRFDFRSSANVWYRVSSFEYYKESTAVILSRGVESDDKYYAIVLANECEIDHRPPVEFSPPCPAAMTLSRGVSSFARICRTKGDTLVGGQTTHVIQTPPSTKWKCTFGCSFVYYYSPLHTKAIRDRIRRLAREKCRVEEHVSHGRLGRIQELRKP